MILRGFPLAFDGSPDVTAAVNWVNGEFEVSEELASINSLHAVTTGKKYFLRNWENTNSEQSKVKSAKMLLQLIVVKICVKQNKA